MVHQKAIAGLMGLASTASALQGLPMTLNDLAKRNEKPTISRRQAAKYPAYTVSTPVDHFHNETIYEPHSNGTFDLRYWFDDQFYEPGGPVFVLSGGETSGEGRLPFLEKGIVYEVTKATKGLGVILEHRYYGTSMPTADFSTENLRFLTTEQALADTAYFAEHVEFDGMGDYDLSPESTPWIAYGGSYAGAFVAFLRVQYPDIYMGAISSSGVPAAIWDYWEYYEGARQFGPKTCIENTQKIVNVVDEVLLNNTDYTPQLKELFGQSGMSDDQDFASAVTSSGINLLQSLNWDPTQSDDGFFTYCDLMAKTESQYPALESKRESVSELVKVAGYGEDLVDPMLNYLGDWGVTVKKRCGSTSTKDCFSSELVAAAAQNDDDPSRAWPYQVCTEWGFLQTGDTPADILPLVSRLVDLEYSAKMCKTSFGLTKPADTDRVNKYGAFNISYPNLAFLDGEWDPWRNAGVHSTALGDDVRPTTPDEPMFLIDDAVHHWDENGLFPNETTAELPPKPVKDAKAFEIEFVKGWLKDWEGNKGGYPSGGGAATGKRRGVKMQAP